MAVSEVFTATGTATGAALTPKQWSAVLHREVQNKSFFTRNGLKAVDKSDRFGLDEDNVGAPIILKTELEKNRGDNVTTGLVKNLTGTGKYGVQTLQGYEEAQAYYNFNTPIELIRHGTGVQGFVLEQRHPFRMTIDELSRGLLTNWMAKWLDDDIFSAFYSGYSSHLISGSVGGASTVTHPSGNLLYAGAATSTATLNEDCVLNADMLERLNVWAEVNNINPIKVDGRDYFALLVHPYQWKTLRQSDLREDLRMAGERGNENPIFSGADLVYSNIIVFKTNKVAAVGSTGEDANRRKAILMGAHAMAECIGRRPWFEVRDDTDFGLIKAVAINSIVGHRRADWTSDDGASTRINQSSAVVFSYAANPNA